MAIYSIYFSPTGGTKKVMDLLTDSYHGAKGIDLARRDTDYSTYRFTRDDICLIGVPAYGGRVPAHALERVLQMRGEEPRTVIVATYGNRAYDDTLLELGDALQRGGFRIIAAIAAVTEHSIVRKYGTGRPDAQDRAELRTFMEQIRALPEDAGRRAAVLPGNKPYKEYHSGPMRPAAGEACVKCGLCATQCPVGAIKSESPAQTSNSCICCMRCIAICPRHARALDTTMLDALDKKLETLCAGRKPNELFLF